MAVVSSWFSKESALTSLLIALTWTVLNPSGRIHAQVGTATLSGVVRDPSGSSIPNARVTLASTAQKFSRQTSTDVQGAYIIPAIPPGTYKLEVTASGFNTEDSSEITLSSGQASTFNVTLSVAAATEQVTVSEAPPLLQTTTATVGSVVESKQFNELPLLGRNFSNLILITPAVAPVEAVDLNNISFGGLAVNPSVYGQRQRDNNFTLDGVSNNDPLFSGVPMFPPPEAIPEMKVESGMSSGAYGHASGANINLVTKAGTNELHGDVWEFLRNNKLNARSFFLPSLGAFKWNQFGGAVGGPLVIPRVLSKEKGWYFFAYFEGIRQRTTSNATALVPTADQLNGNFAGSTPIFDPYTTTIDSAGNPSRQPFPGNRIPANRLNASAIMLAKALYPLPNLAPGIIPGVNYLNAAAGNRQ